MKFLPISLLFAALTCLAASAETYRSVPVSKLKFEGDPKEVTAALDLKVDAFQLRSLDVRLATESYLTHEDREVGDSSQSQLRVVFKGDAKLPLKGALELAMDYSADEVKTFRFTIVEGSAKEIDKEEFIRARKRWAQARKDGSLPGVAWYRHQAGHANEREGAISPMELMSTYDIFSGGRAIADNLALDRDLLLAVGEDESMVRIDTIEGVTVKAIDWSEQLPKEEVAVDPLALFIPEDQHALFAPSLPGLLKLMNQLEGEATPLVGTISSESAYRGLLKRYRRQLGMDITDAAALLLPVRSVAVTGGDPYFATGTDVAVLMETEKPEALFQALKLGIQTQTKFMGIQFKTLSVEGVSFVLPEKGFSSHICKLGDLVFVTNSMAQVRRIEEVVDRRAPALGKTDEFKVFRHRYPKAGEHAFIFLSDATIRRWAGPVTRIGASRRNRALAALNELTCRGITPCGKDNDFEPLLGRVAMLKGRAVSERYGSAGFLTPISELGLTEVTGMERQSYENWREGYENGWTKVFDPIAIQLKLGKQSVDVDLTVLPLNVNSDFQEIMEVAGDAKLTPRARLRPEGSILRLACAIDPDSKRFEGLDGALLSMMPELKIKPLSWVGDSVSVDFLDSLYWEGIGTMGVGSQIEQMPVVARVEVKSKLKLGLFLTGMRTLLQTSAPDTFEWINRKHGERTYVVIAEQEEDEFDEPIRICYAIVDKALLVTLNERSLKHAMDLEEMELTEEQLAKLPPAKSLFLDADPGLLRVFDAVVGDGSRHSRSAVISWEAIPILNEWRQRFPGRDPQEVHQSLFGVGLDCPGGKGYRWNEEHLTMESVAFGHRGAPRELEQPIQGLAKYGRIHSGFDFEDGGLRMRLHLGPETELPTLPQPEVGEVIGKGAELASYKPGRVLYYDGEDEFGQQSWSQEVVSIEKTPKGLLVKANEPWVADGDQGNWEARYLVADDGVWQMGGNDALNTTSYSKPSLELPKVLRANEVHRCDAVGQDVYEDNGEKQIDPLRSRTIIRVIGTETIQVKAGKFENCVVIERRTESLWADYFDLHDARQWYHPGTGLIKETDESGGMWELVKIENK